MPATVSDTTSPITTVHAAQPGVLTWWSNRNALGLLRQKPANPLLEERPEPTDRDLFFAELPESRQVEALRTVGASAEDNESTEVKGTRETPDWDTVWEAAFDDLVLTPR